MTLRVSLEDFPEAVHRYGGGTEVYVSGPIDALTVTSHNDETGVIITTIAEEGLESLKHYLGTAGLELRDGAWEAETGLDEVHVAGVAYISKEPLPGLWMDAFPYPPSTQDVMRAFYDDMIEGGEISGITFEQFRKLVNPNVVVLSPADLQGFASRKRALPKPGT